MASLRRCLLIASGVAFRWSEAWPSMWQTRMGYCRAPESGDFIMGNPVEMASVQDALSEDGEALSVSTPSSMHLLATSSGTFSNPSSGAHVLCDGKMVAWNYRGTSRSVMWHAPAGSVATLAVAEHYGPVKIYTLAIPRDNLDNLSLAASFLDLKATPTTLPAGLAPSLDNSTAAAPRIKNVNSTTGVSTTSEMDLSTRRSNSTTTAETGASTSATVSSTITWQPAVTALNSTQIASTTSMQSAFGESQVLRTTRVEETTTISARATSSFLRPISTATIVSSTVDDAGGSTTMHTKTTFVSELTTRMPSNLSEPAKSTTVDSSLLSKTDGLSFCTFVIAALLVLHVLDAHL